MSSPQSANISLEEAVREAEAAYVTANPESKAFHARACAAMPGGNTRTSLYYEPFPLTIVRGEGAYIWDADGHKYVDFLGEYTCGLLGHSNPVVLAAVAEKLKGGLSMGAPGVDDAAFAAAICDRFPTLDLVRFCNSGTEANMLALNTAREVTGRETVMVFEGAYHGSGLAFPPGGMNFTQPFDFIVCPYNDIDAARSLIADNRDRLAAVLIEGMQGAGGCNPGDPDFLTALQEETQSAGALFIMDEVMTSRLSPSGLQGKYGLSPDLTSLGKYLGGGMSFGAFGGRADIMERFDPGHESSFMHAGTFNNNVLTMAAGLATVTQVLTDDALNDLNARGDALRDKLNAIARDAGAPVEVTGVGSLMTVHFPGGDPGLWDLLQFDLFAAGYYIPHRGMIVLSLPLTDDDIGGLAAAFGEFVETRRAVMTV